MNYDVIINVVDAEKIISITLIKPIFSAYISIVLVYTTPYDYISSQTHFLQTNFFIIYYLFMQFHYWLIFEASSNLVINRR